MKWNEQVAKAISGSITCLHGIGMIRKFFEPKDVKNLLTALYYSKLYYGSEIWQILGLSLALNKNFKFASVNAAKLCLNRPNLHQATYTKIHKRANRAKPAATILYRHAILAFKLFKDILCKDKFLHLNFQLVDNVRETKLNFIKRQNYDVGKNILLNRMQVLNNKIDKNWLNLSLDSYKIKCKKLF